MIDSHLHLSHKRFHRHRAPVISRARAEGVAAAVEIGSHLGIGGTPTCGPNAEST